ncbi:MAG TPA: hypothetical protein VG274_01785, partial [Rhizomicrobium sp.]|nr:hypothetical protein [Rhizomicrobium sp.]
LLWGRFTEAQLLGKKRWSRTGYFGHTPVVNYSAGAGLVPVRGHRIVLLDTASALMPEGMLSAMCAESGRVIQADRLGQTIELPDH